MKKLFLLFTVLLATVGQVRAAEYVAFQPSSPVRISWDNSTYAGTYYDTNEHSADGAFTTLSAGDVIKVHVTGVVGVAGTDSHVAISFKPHEYDWTTITSYAAVNLAQGIITVPVEAGSGKYTPSGGSETDVQWTAAEMATAIKTRGFVVSGIKFQLLDITVETTNVTSEGFYNTTLCESHNCGNWSGLSNIIASGTTLSTDDYITCTVTLNTTSNSGQALFQYQASSWTTLSKGQVWMNANDEAKNATISFSSDDLTNISTYGLALNGDNVTVTNVVLHKKLTLAGYRPVYIPASGYATFYGASTCALPDGVEAYYVSSTTNESATLTGLSNIPANQGVILKGSEGIYQLYTTADAAASVKDNMLVGVVTREQITDASGKYVLYNNGGNPEFRTITAGTYLDAFKCYLYAPGVTPSKLNIVFAEDENKQDEEPQGETTSIRNIANTNVNNNVVYNMNGQRVGSDYKGIVIINGKKYLHK